MFINNHHASFHLWGKGKLVKHQEVSKYYESDCRSRPGDKYTNYRTGHSAMMVIRIN